MERDFGSGYPPGRKKWEKKVLERDRGSEETFPLPTKLAGRSIQRILEDVEESSHDQESGKLEPRESRQRDQLQKSPRKVGTRPYTHALDQGMRKSSSKRPGLCRQRTQGGERKSLSDGGPRVSGRARSLSPWENEGSVHALRPSWPLEGSYAKRREGEEGAVRVCSL